MGQVLAFSSCLPHIVKSFSWSLSLLYIRLDTALRRSPSRRLINDVDHRDLCSRPFPPPAMNGHPAELSPSSRAHLPNGDVPSVQRAHYEPPWSNTSIIGIAGSSGSGKTSLSLAIINELNLPWVVLMSMDSFYKPLTSDESKAAFRNEYDFDAPEAIDFDLLVERLGDVKAG